MYKFIIQGQTMNKLITMFLLTLGLLQAEVLLTKENVVVGKIYNHDKVFGMDINGTKYRCYNTASSELHYDSEKLDIIKQGDVCHIHIPNGIKTSFRY